MAYYLIYVRSMLYIDTCKIKGRNYDVFLSCSLFAITGQEIGVRCIAAEVDERIRAACERVVTSTSAPSACKVIVIATINRSRLRKVDQ